MVEVAPLDGATLEPEGGGNHEEQYSGDSLRGNYLAGIYYPDPTRVGWWKNGYPDYFAKVQYAASLLESPSEEGPSEAKPVFGGAAAGESI